LPSTSIQTIVSCGRPFGLNDVAVRFSYRTFFTDSGNPIGMWPLPAQVLVAGDQEALAF